jgi:hypothetical protein
VIGAIYFSDFMDIEAYPWLVVSFAAALAVVAALVLHGVEIERAQAPSEHASPAPPPPSPGRGGSTAIREPTHAGVHAQRDARSPAESRG